jgi:hypothetical protein
MRKFFARRILRSFGARYNYDTAYMDAMLREASSAFFKFAKIMGLAQHREVVPVDAYYTAKLVGALAEDCGPCAQLVVDMAREAGMQPSQIEAVLAGNMAAMTEQTAIAFRFARAIVDRSLDDVDTRDVVRAKWGEKGVIELTLGLQVGRIFPMVKAGMGYALECRKIAVDGKDVEINRSGNKHAA